MQCDKDKRQQWIKEYKKYTDFFFNEHYQELYQVLREKGECK